MARDFEQTDVEQTCRECNDTGIVRGISEVGFFELAVWCTCLRGREKQAAIAHLLLSVSV